MVKGFGAISSTGKMAGKLGYQIIGTTSSSIGNNCLSIEDCRLKYGIGGACTIQGWLKKFGKNQLLNKIVRIETVEERDELKRLKAELSALKQAYADLSLDHKYSEMVIELADEMFNLDLKKSTNTSALFFGEERKYKSFIWLFWYHSSGLL